MAFLNKNIKFILNWDKDDEHKGSTTFLYEGGIKEYVSFLNEGENLLFDDVLYVDGTDEATNISVEVAFEYNTSYTEKVYSFCNNIFTPEGGMHLDGFRQTLARVLNAYAKDKKFLKPDDPNFTMMI